MEKHTHTHTQITNNIGRQRCHDMFKPSEDQNTPGGDAVRNKDISEFKEKGCGKREPSDHNWCGTDMLDSKELSHGS